MLTVHAESRPTTRVRAHDAAKFPVLGGRLHAVSGLAFALESLAHAGGFSALAPPSITRMLSWLLPHPAAGGGL